LTPATKTWLSNEFTAANGRTVRISVGVICGARPGPTFANVAGQHGMEHIGPMVLRDFFEEVDPHQLAGTLYVCPCANPLALEYDFEVYPEREQLPAPFTKKLTGEMFGYKERNDLGEYNLNRVWGDDIAQEPPAGEGLAGRIARWLWKTMIAPSDVVVDHHAVLSTRKPYIFCEEPVIAWTPFLGFEAVWCTGPLRPSPTEYPYRRLCMQAIRHGKVGICTEYSVQHAIKEEDRAIGRFGLFNMMKALGMIEGAPEIPKPVWLIPGPYWEHLEELKSPHAASRESARRLDLPCLARRPAAGRAGHALSRAAAAPRLKAGRLRTGTLRAWLGALRETPGRTGSRTEGSAPTTPRRTRCRRSPGDCPRS
jgi:predicted deacylase